MKTLIDEFKFSELTVWAVVVNNIVVAVHTGPPELYKHPLSEVLNIKLIEYSDGRGFPKVGDIWDGERFRSQDGKLRSR